jgi:tripartite-type tricarboxylate transporter receptor subunit TctC
MLKKALFALACSMASLLAHAGNGPGGYPQEPVRFVVAFAPGGGTDIVARLVGAELSKRIGQNIIVDNRAGASGIVAAQLVAHAKPDGITLLVGGSGPMVFNRVTNKTLPYDPEKDLEPVTILGSYPIVLLAGKNQPFNTLQEMIQYAKKNPGKLNYGSAGASFQVPTEYFASEAGISLVQVAYKGTALAAQALMAGDVQLLSADIGPGAPLATSGQAKPLAVTSAERNSILPQVPTIAESGVKNFDFSLYSAVAAPKGTPKEIIDYLQKELHAVLHSEDVKKRLAAMGIKPEGKSPQETAARFEREYKLFNPLADRLGLKSN